MDGLNGTGNVRVDSEHGADSRHGFLVAHEFVRYWDAELQYFQLRVTSLLDVSVHVHFVIECLVMLDDETLERSILITLKLVEKVLTRCIWEHLLLKGQGLL